MATFRYDLRQEEDGTWTVFDVFTGLPVVISGTMTNGLDLEEADDLVDLLNLQDAKRRGTIER